MACYATPDADGYGDDPIRLARPPCAPRTLAVTPLCPPAMHRPGPWRLEDYTLHRQLYKGKASLLYSATCKQSGARVALKLYRKSRLSDLNWWQVTREVRLHSRLAHPAIVDLYAAFEDGDHVYLVQEYADGGDLYEALRRAGGRLREPRVAAAVVAPVLDALAYLHARGVVHRDIKPENVLLCRDAAPGGDPSRHVIKLADFGLSICARLERPVTRAGTLDYMSPEVVVCPEKCHPLDNKDRADLGYGAAVDVWAVGVLAYELVVGRPPFEAETRAETCDAITRGALRFPSGTSDGLRAYVTASCARVAASRPPAAAMRAHPWVLRHAPATAAAAAAAGLQHEPSKTRPAGDGDGLGAVLQWAGAAGKTLTRLLAPGAGRGGGAADNAPPAAPAAPADGMQRAPSGRPPLAPGLSTALSGALSGGGGGGGGGTAPATPVGEIKAWHGAPPASPAAPAPSPASSAALSPAPSVRVPSPWARSRSGRESPAPAAPRAGGLAAWRARRAAASGSLAVASASSGSLDLVDTPCRPGVAFPSGRAGAAPPQAKRSLSSSLHAASSWSTMDTS